jgi:deoxyribonuclease V
VADWAQIAHYVTCLQRAEETLAMQLAISHPWDLSVAEARDLQQQLAGQVVTRTTFDPAVVRTVAGVDVSIRENLARSAVVVLSFPDLEPVEYAMGQAPATFPYVPGLLTFREGPSVLDALEKLSTWPDLFIFDGQGIAHPHRIGLAAHLGVILDHPSIGCAKSRLTGVHGDPGPAVGDWAPLVDRGETIGAVLRSRANVKPLYVSIGHRVDLPTAIDLVSRSTRGYRLPETTRYAHKAAGGAELEVGQAQSRLF